MFTLTPNENFASRMSERDIDDGIKIISVHAEAKGESALLELTLDWRTPDVGVHAVWTPLLFASRQVRPHWLGYASSNASQSAPVLSTCSYNDQNCLTIACSDAKNRVDIMSGPIEENAMMMNQVVIRVECKISVYDAEIRLDTRKLPFYRCIEDTVKWWESFEGYEPVKVPEYAKRAMYSSWYSFHQQIDIPHILEECRYFHALGCDSIIIDDGWQTDDNNRGYAYCGDWRPAYKKVPDMKGFVDAVHETGMKFIMWYSVPFVGIHSNAYNTFKDKMLYAAVPGEVFVLDPRYPEVREYLISCYKNALLDWGLDGFKLDFIDSFTQSENVKKGMDYVSVYDGVDRLMKDVASTLREINPDILIEFRQNYIGPLMRTFGNMFRAGDCPNDSYTNRVRTLALRMTSGETAVHSDMVMWNYEEPVELAAFQMTNILYSVPQVSVLHDKMPQGHARMVKNYLTLWNEYRDVLLEGEMVYHDYAADFTTVGAYRDGRAVCSLYTGQVVRIDREASDIVVVNATMHNDILLRADFGGEYDCSVCDCMGDEVERTHITLAGGGFSQVSGVPVNGTLHLKMI